MVKALPDRRDAGAREHVGVEIALRAAAAREIDPGAELVAEVEDAIGLRTRELERRSANDRHFDREPVARELEHHEVELEQVRPAAAQEDVLEIRRVALPVRGAAVVDFERAPRSVLPVMASTAPRVVDAEIADAIGLRV